MPYLFTYSLSYILCFLGEKSKNKIASYLFLILSVFCVSFLAGMRDYTIGVDTVSYTKFFFETVNSFSSFRAFYQHYIFSYEPGFIIWGYLIHLISDEYNCFLFMTACVIYGFVMCSLRYYKNFCSISMAWLFFITFSCTEALNITRQYMAMSIAVWAFHYLTEKKYLKYFLWTLIAMSFHVSAVISFIVMIIYLIIKRNNKFVTRFGVISAFLLLILGFEIIVSIFSRIGFIANKLSFYINGAHYSFQINPFIIRVPFIMILLLSRKSFREKNHIFSYGHDILKHHKLTMGEKNYFQINKLNADFMVVLLFVEMIICQMRGINVGFYRMTGFFYVFKFVSYSRVIYTKKGIDKIVIYLFAYMYIITVFVYWTVILNSGHIYPYTSEILNIK